MHVAVELPPLKCCAGMCNGSVADALSGERGDGSARNASASVPRGWRGRGDPIILPMVRYFFFSTYLPYHSHTPVKGSYSRAPNRLVIAHVNCNNL